MSSNPIQKKASPRNPDGNQTGDLASGQDSKKQTVFEDDDPAVLNASEIHAMTTMVKNLDSEKLNYLTDMLLELKKLSDEINEPMISYIIEMAYLEATTSRTVRDFSEELK